MRRTIIAMVLALGLILLMVPTAISAASGVEVTGRTGDGAWTDSTWKVELFPGETKSTAIKLYNSSSSSLDVEVTIIPDSLDNGNLIFELDKTTFTMPGRSYTSVTLTVKASGSATPGIYTTELEIKSETPPRPPVGGRAPDRKPPRIYDIGLCSEGVTETTAYICWTTNEKSTSQVEYWSSPTMLSPLDETYVIKHHVELTGLTPDTLYYYKMMSEDKAGNLGISDEYSFTTLGKEPEPIPKPEAPEPEPEPEEPELIIEPEEPEGPEGPVEPEEPVEPYVPPEEPEPEAETPWGLIGGVVGGLAAAGGIGYWLWRRRRERR